MRLFAEEVGVGAGTGKAEFRRSGFVHEEPIGSDVAFAFREPVANEGMVTVGGGERLPVCQQFEDAGQFGEVPVTPFAEFEVTLELGGGDNGFHRASFSRASTESYRERLRSLSRSSMACRVVSLGVSSASSDKVMGQGKPRWARDCMRRTFMAVEVDMPRRAKRSSARRLVSGDTRKAMVAVLDMAGCSPFVVGCMQHKTVGERLQAKRGDLR